MRNFIHIKKNSDPAAPESVETDAGAVASVPDGDAGQTEDGAATARDVETEDLKNAIAQVMAEESAVLPHIEQLSSSISKESVMNDDETEETADEPADEIITDIVEETPDTAEPQLTNTQIINSQAKINSWFVTFMTMRIPIVGWIYLLYLAFSKKTVNRRNFARAYLLVKLIFLVLGLIILWLIVSEAMNLLQDLLDYMAML